MTRYFDVHPKDPQPHRIAQLVAMLRDGDARREPLWNGRSLPRRP